MAMPLTVPHYTIADLDSFPEDGNRYEVLYGMLLVTPAPGTMHQIVLARLTMSLAAYLGPAGLAHLAIPGVVQTGPDTQLEPDLLVIPTHYQPGISWRSVTDRWLAVEVSGRDSRIYDRDYKRDAYLHFGVREMWRLDLRDRSVYVSRLGEPRDLPHGEQLDWHPSEMPVPLRVDVRALFYGYQASRWS
jgi:Uma2 family endonuclease